MIFQVEIALFVISLIICNVLSQISSESDSVDVHDALFDLACGHTTSPHHTPLPGDTCCNGTVIHDGINDRDSVWIECQNVKSRESETAQDAYWRVYSCVLSKIMDSKSETISLFQFAQIMSEHYPDDIENSILDKVEDLVSKSKNKLNAEISVIYQVNINQIRAAYFDIEKQVCGETSATEVKVNTDKCTDYEESFHRDAGGCCGNVSIPFKPLYRSPAHIFEDITCNDTFAVVLDKFDKDEHTREIVLEFFHFSCYLVEKSFLTLEDLLKVSITVPPPMKIIVSSAFPYLPENVQLAAAREFELRFNGTAVMEELTTFLQNYENNVNLIEYKDILYSGFAFQTAHFLLESIHPTCGLGGI